MRPGPAACPSAALSAASSLEPNAPACAPLAAACRLFQADEVRLDHHALEVPTWNDVRDWGDHLAGLHIGIDWGPGRHGPGNNLFFMIRDPDDNWIEISQDLERMPLELAHRDWPHTEYTLNTWGRGVLRS